MGFDRDREDEDADGEDADGGGAADVRDADVRDAEDAVAPDAADPGDEYEDEPADIADDGEVVGDCPVGDAVSDDAACDADDDEIAAWGEQPHSTSPHRRATAGRPDRRLRMSTAPPSDGVPCRRGAGPSG
ncbi:hypothetical protein [Geodermatophilus sp. URMC 64]